MNKLVGNGDPSRRRALTPRKAVVYGSAALLALSLAACGPASKPNSGSCGEGQESTAPLLFNNEATGAEELLVGQGWNTVNQVDAQAEARLGTPGNLRYYVYADVAYGGDGLTETQAQAAGSALTKDIAAQSGETADTRASQPYFMSQVAEGVGGVATFHFVPAADCVGIPVLALQA